MNSIKVIFSVDDNYAPYLGATLCSIFENKAVDSVVAIYVIDGGISETSKQKLKLTENKYDFSINYIPINLSDYADLPERSYVTRATYYKLMIPHLIDQNIEKILYLDCDLLVVDDLAPLFNYNIADYPLAAVAEEQLIEVREKIGLSNDQKYFNTGVILINAKKWRALDISHKSLDFIRKNPDKITYAEQDALNAVLSGQCLPIDKIYNFCVCCETKKKTIKKNPLIIHYFGGLKPWHFLYTGPFKKLYKSYLKKTAWKMTAYNKDLNFINFIKRPIFVVFPKKFIIFLVNVRNASKKLFV